MVDPNSVTEIDGVEGYFFDHHYSSISDDEITDMFECYLTIPEQDSPEENPLNFGYIREQQQLMLNSLQDKRSTQNNTSTYL